MEWVETTGKTVEEAKETALDQLGVDEQDAEFEVVEEPRTGLFGRTRGEARIRARVRPTQPRPKVERRDRRGKAGARGGRAGGERRGGSGGGGRGPGAKADAAAADVVQAKPPSAPTAGVPAKPPGARRSAKPGRVRGGGSASGQGSGDQDHEQGRITMSETELAAQGEVIRGFLADLLDAFGLEGDVTATPAEEGAMELAVTGEDLGLLIGPKGATLQALQELSRSVLQRRLPGESHARIRVDVSGYRARRKLALEAFARQLAEDVRASGTQKVLEPMSPADRKVVHDTVNEIDGVHTISEGEDARRRVVILPDS